MKTLSARSALMVLGLICGVYGNATSHPAVAQQHKASKASPAHPATAQAQIQAQNQKKDDPTAKAKGVLRDIERMEHPEAHTPVGSPGWIEERNAASVSFHQKLQSEQSKLILLGPSITPLLAENLSSANADVAQTCSNVLAQFGEAAVPSIVDTIKKLGPQPMAVSALKQIGPDCLPALTKLLQSSDNSECYSALKCIDSLLPDTQFDGLRHVVIFRHARFNNEMVLPLSVVSQVCKITTKDKSVKFREEACVLLGKVGPRSPQVVETLLNCADDEQPSVRLTALAALGGVAVSQTGDSQVKTINVLVHALQNDDYDGARVEAATVLGNIPDAAPVAVPALIKALDDGYSQVSSAASQALGNYGEKSELAVPVLEALIKNKPNSSEACNAVRSLGRMKGAAVSAMPTIVSCLKTGEHQMQTAALSAVESLGPLAAPAVAPLVDLLSNQDIAIRYSVFRALGGIGPKASDALPKLQEEIKTHANEVGMINQAIRKISGENSETSSRRPVIVIPSQSQNGSGSSI
jgi:HEAT repeat protein